jgi:multiple sugar transport system permease protein
MVPGVAILLPLLLLSEKLHLDNTLIGLALVYQILVIPFCTWMLKGFFASIPREIDEAARIDGCSPLSSLWRIVLPISGPGVFVTAMFSWMVAWEEFLFALTLTRDNSSRTIPVGIDFFMGEHYIDWGPIMATSVLMSVPIIILFFFFQDKYIQGIAGGAVKG